MPSRYEEQALQEIHAWKEPATGWFAETLQLLNIPLDAAGNLLNKTPGVGRVMHKSVGGLVSVANDVAQWSVRPEAIFKEYQDTGSAVTSHQDLLALDLGRIDRAIGWLGAKYKGLALTEGTAFGALGLPGIPLDVVSLVTLNLRAIGEYATYCGFDVSSQPERLFALNVLGFASSPTNASKALAMAQLVRIAQDVAKKKVWRDLQQHAFVALMQQLSKALGIRLSKAKLGQAVPLAGAAVGGGFNAYFTAKVCDAAYFLYRERFLAEKYGADFVDVVTPPAADLDPHYPEEQEELPSEDALPDAG